MTVTGHGKIWICDSYLDSSIVKRLSLLPDNKGYTPELQRLGEIRRKYQQGEKLDEDESPRVAYGKYRDTRFRKLPDFFCVDGFFAVS